ncbi:MAG: GDP-mannose 4,6-dehydratase, partial [Eubacteriales bacterium]
MYLINYYSKELSDLTIKDINKDKSYLITGAAGFIGSFLAKRLLKEGCKVIGIDNINDYYDTNLK